MVKADSNTLSNLLDNAALNGQTNLETIGITFSYEFLFNILILDLQAFL